MTMTDAQPMSPTAPGSRLVTVDDLRYEFQRERAITDAHFMRITSHIESLDRRFASVDARFEQVDARFASVDARFDRLETRLEARFDAIDERLRFNKTLIVASFSAVASVASVVVSLLR
jgi:uncharacterized protein YdcH (DUF465 family)